MYLRIFSILSSEWGISRFITDLCALTALGIFVGFAILLIKHRIEIRSLWVEGNAISDRFE
tara:strand:- start:2846 stop:3028 length:183 start_codon:yes stop_codon:yes gene_type:complete